MTVMPMMRSVHDVAREIVSRPQLIAGTPSPHAPLRVLHVVLHLAPGGTEQLVIDMVARMQERHHVEVAVCCLDDEGPWSEKLKSRGIPVEAVRRQPGFHPLLGWAIARASARHRAEVIHCHQYTPFVYGTLAGIVRPGLRVVFTEHGRLYDDVVRAKRVIANRLLGWRPQAITTVSEELKAYLAAQGFDPDRIRVVRNGIDPGSAPTPHARRAARLALGLPADALIIGSVARLDPVKSLDTLVRAFSDLHQSVPDARLAIVGDGPEREPLARLVRREGLGGSIRLIGPHPAAREVMPAFDMYVNSSTSEGISVTILEAMAAAVPVVATNVGGTPEVVENGRTGLLVPPRDPHALAMALRRLIGAPAERAACGEAGRKRVLEAFSLDRMVMEYLSVYRGDKEGR
jgi:glycosyltransferase involved in cell wall biosynthesis